MKPQLRMIRNPRPLRMLSKCRQPKLIVLQQDQASTEGNPSYNQTMSKKQSFKQRILEKIRRFLSSLAADWSRAREIDLKILHMRRSYYAKYAFHLQYFR